MKKEIKFEFQGKTYNIQAERNGSVLTIENEGKAFNVNLIEEQKTQVRKPAAPAAAPAPAAPAAPAPAPAAAAPAPAAGAGSEKAAITGTIKEVKVAKGASVNAGDLIVMMEAMKMDIEVFASKSGTVTEIYVTPGVNVAEGQPLMDIG